MQVFGQFEWHAQPPERPVVERTISLISKISAIRPKAAAPPISSAAKVEDSDMARSLALGGVIALEIHQPALHDRAGRHIRLFASHRPTGEGHPGLGVAQPLIERPR